jgi:hypothetical protein
LVISGSSSSINPGINTRLPSNILFAPTAPVSTAPSAPSVNNSPVTNPVSPQGGPEAADPC